MKAINLILFSMPQHSKKIQSRINIVRLVDSLLEKLNDPKEIVRAEIERIIVKLSQFYKMKELLK